MLLQAIGDEPLARKAADDELHGGINEARIVGRYAFSGPFTCISSTTGFNDDFTPRSPTPGFNAFIQVVSGITTGFRNLQRRRHRHRDVL